MTARLIAAEERQAVEHAAWQEADLAYLLHHGQREALNLIALHLFVVLCIARRWGKTWLACVWLVMVAIRVPGARCLYAAPTGKMVREFAWPHLRAIAEHAPADVRPVIVGDEMRFPNGSRIVAFGCEDTTKADRGRGPGCDAAVIDEGGFIDCLEYVIRSVIGPQLMTTRTPGASGPLLLISTPPPSPAHPFTTFARQAEQAGAYMQRALQTAPHLSPEQIAEYVKLVGGVDSPDYKREILAQLVVDPHRAIVPEWTDALIGDAPSRGHIDRYVVGDLGYIDMTVILFAEWDFASAQIVVVDELVVERTTSAEIQSMVRDREHTLWQRSPIHRRLIDAPPITRADMTRLQRMQGEDMSPEQAAAESTAHWQGVRTADPEAAVNALRMACQRRTIRVHSRCKVTAWHMKHGIWNERRTDFARSEGLGHFDGVAAMMYLVRHVDRTHNPTPALMIDPATQWLSPTAHDLLLPAQARTVKKWAGALTRKRTRA